MNTFLTSIKTILIIIPLILISHADQKCKDMSIFLEKNNLANCFVKFSHGELSWFSVQTRDEISRILNESEKNKELKKYELALELLEKLGVASDYKASSINATQAEELINTFSKWKGLLTEKGGTANNVIAFACDYHITHLQLFLHSQGLLKAKDFCFHKKDRIDWKHYLIKNARNNEDSKYFKSLSGKENIIQLIDGYGKSTGRKISLTNIKTSDLIESYDPVISLTQVASIDFIKSQIFSGLLAFEQGGGNIQNIETVTNTQFSKITDEWAGSYSFFSRRYIGLRDLKETIYSVTTQFERSKQNLRVRFE